MSLCDECKLKDLNLTACGDHLEENCADYIQKNVSDAQMLHQIVHKQTSENDPVNSPNHYVGKIECIDYLRDKLTPAEFTGFCMGNVLKYCSRWRKKDGVQDLHKALVYLQWAIENEEKRT